MSLVKNTPEGANGNLTFVGNDDSIDRFAALSNKLHVAALLTSLEEAAGFKSALDLAEGSGLSRPNLNLNGTNLGGPSGSWRLKMKFQGLFKIGKGLFFGLTLTRDVHFQALGYIPIALAPHCGREWPLHDFILPHKRSSKDVSFQTPAAI
jgi:hypothetical protein